MKGAIRTTAAILALAFVAGCQNSQRAPAYDPLIGDGPISQPPANSVTRRDEPNRDRNRVPPIPPATTTSSPAALTVGAVSATGSSTPKTGVQLQAPRAKGGTSTTSTASSETDQGSTTPSAGSYESLQQQLQSRGIVWQQLRMVEPDRWDYYCAIPDPKQSSVRRNYEARGRATAVEAMRAVLAEIDAERQ